MGCDIHIMTEIRKDGNWMHVPEIPKSFDDRNYSLFSLLAGVRNYFDTDGFAPKGIPEDVAGLKYGFVNYADHIGKVKYENPNETMRVFVGNDGTIKKYTSLNPTKITKEEYNRIKEALEDKTNVEIKKHYTGLSASYKGNCAEYFVIDAFAYDGEFKNLPYSEVFPTLEDFIADYYEDEWDESQHTYGYWDINFEDPLESGDYHTPSYLTLKELQEKDYTDFFMEKYKLDKSFYDVFCKFGGKIPDGITISEHNPNDIVDTFQYAFSPVVIASWKQDDETIKNSALYKGIEELKAIAEKYEVDNTEDIRIVFAFDN